MENDKYKMFKNFLHNELEISREDIREWIKDAVKDEVTRLVDNEYGKFNVRDYIKQTLIKHSVFGTDKLKDEIKYVLTNLIVNKLDIKLNKE
ncbi:MAG: hypothetical protein RBT49_04110 [Bacteroidales bacterium]|jgi:hypothetical protein|nr:hypothetical protein [Bacteroidales bacterium]